MSNTPVWTENYQSRLMFRDIKQMLRDGCTKEYIINAIDSYIEALDEAKARFESPAWRELAKYYDEHGTRGD